MAEFTSRERAGSTGLAGVSNTTPSQGAAPALQAAHGLPLLLVVASLLALLLLATTARAQDVGDELAAEGYVVEDGADDVDESQLQSAIADARNAGVDLSVAFLTDRSGGAEPTADSLVERVDGAVLVVTPSEIGASSTHHSGEELDSALDAAAAELEAGDDPVDAVVAFANELEAGDAAGGFDTSQLPGPLAGMSVPALIIGAIVLLVVFSLLSRLFGGGRRRRSHHGGYGGGYGRRRRGGFGSGLAGGLIGGAVGSRMGRGSGGRGGSTGASRSRSRSSAGRSRSSGSRSRSRSSGSRRR